MSSVNRKEYETATVLDQNFLNRSHDNLVNQLELIAEIETPLAAPDDIIYASDRNKYVGDKFYEALLEFPVIRRTVGDWLSAALEFSSVRLVISNADGRFNAIMPGGADYDSFVNRNVEIKMGLRDVSSTFVSIFRGKITEVAGFSRSIKSFQLFIRNDFDKVNTPFPRTTLETTTFPDLEAELIGTVLPVVYGDWSDVTNPPPIPAWPVNGADSGVQAGTANVEVRFSENVNTQFDPTSGSPTDVVYYQRGSQAIQSIAPVQLVNVNANKNGFEIDQTTGSYNFMEGDTYLVTCKGQGFTSGKNENIIEIAKDVLIRYGGLSASDFDSNWDTIRDKSTPTVSAISTFKSRLWIQEQQPAIVVALSLLEQVRVEAFVSRDLKFKLLPLHFDEYDASPSFTVRNWDIERNTFRPRLDKRNHFNKARGIYNFLPSINDNLNSTSFFRNQNAIDQIDGKILQKIIVFPNLKEASVVSNQVKEILKLSSAGFEFIDMTLTWRSILKDIGDFVAVDVQIGAAVFNDVPCLIRTLGYDAKGLRVPVTVWSFLNVPFDGHSGTGGGIVGGSTATILEG